MDAARKEQAADVTITADATMAAVTGAWATGAETAPILSGSLSCFASAAETTGAIIVDVTTATATAAGLSSSFCSCADAVMDLDADNITLGRG